MKKFIGYLRLLRLPNIITSISDVLGGMAIGGSIVALTIGRSSSKHIPLGELIIREASNATWYQLFMLILATACLYGGGVVMNDVFDAALDKKERPERPIPSGLISLKAATILGYSLLIAGILFAAISNPEGFAMFSFLFALAIALGALIYDKWMKHRKIAGPVTMGLCRGFNLLLGISLVPFAIQHYWFVGLVPVIYIAAITMISRGEVHGGKRQTLYVAAGLYGIVILAIFALAYLNNSLLRTLPFLGLFALMIFAPLQSAIVKPEGPNIGNAVKSGVLALIIMNASWAAAFGDPYFALLIILLLPVSYMLSRVIAVT